MTPPARVEWFGEFGADRWAAEDLGRSRAEDLARTGFYVDVGAGDGVTRSNTLALERLGWSGVCVEASTAFDRLVANRRALCSNAYVGPRGGALRWHENAGDRTLSGDPSRMLAKFRPPGELGLWRATVALDEVLAELGAPRRIDFLSLDVEGAEAIVLEAHDWRAFAFDRVAVEHNGQESKRRRIRDLLAGEGLRLVASVGVDDFYSRRSPAARELSNGARVGFRD